MIVAVSFGILRKYLFSEIVFTSLAKYVDYIRKNLDIIIIKNFVAVLLVCYFLYIIHVISIILIYH